VHVAHVPVQGRGADKVIAQAIDALDRRRVDVIALVRGGGSRLDLATFDSELVARAISNATAPVFTGIGHEIDNSIADIVAHTSFKTPTACAAAIVARARAGIDRLEDLWHTAVGRFDDTTARADQRLRDEARALARVVDARMDLAAHRIDAAAGRITRTARGQIAAAAATVDSAGELIGPRAHRALRQADRHLELCEATASGADPARLLRRGWSITRTGAGSVVRDARALAPGDRLVTTVLEGAIESEVIAVDSHHSAIERTDES
jgi:exodeoxyribonuclease VII large subunit